MRIPGEPALRVLLRYRWQTHRMYDVPVIRQNGVVTHSAILTVNQSSFHTKTCSSSARLSARLNCHEPLAHLTDVLEHLPTQVEELWNELVDLPATTEDDLEVAADST